MKCGGLRGHTPLRAGGGLAPRCVCLLSCAYAVNHRGRLGRQTSASLSFLSLWLARLSTADAAESCHGTSAGTAAGTKNRCVPYRSLRCEFCGGCSCRHRARSVCVQFACWFASFSPSSHRACFPTNAATLRRRSKSTLPANVSLAGDAPASPSGCTLSEAAGPSRLHSE